jgi:hypothetical protein
MHKEGNIFRGFTYDGKEYLVYLDESIHPFKCIVNFPNSDRPIRVELSGRSSCFSALNGTSERCSFMIPAETHFEYDCGWKFFRVNDKMLLSEERFGDIVFLEQTEGFEWVKDNFVDLPDDIYTEPTFVNFDDKLCVVKLYKKYHRDLDSFKAIIAFWWPSNGANGAVNYPKIIDSVTYRDGGTYKATLEHNGETLKLCIPTPLDKEAKAWLNDSENGIVTTSRDNGYQKLFNQFRRDSGLKLYHIDSVLDDDKCPCNIHQH